MIVKENSAVRDTHAGRLYAEGARAEKARVLESLPRELADLHRDAVLHIHDLDGWNDVGNCLTPCPESYLKPHHLASETSRGKIGELFDQVWDMLTNVGHRQTGGIGCGNFDLEIGAALREARIPASDETALAFREEALRFFRKISSNRLRNACENFYVTLNMGLDTSDWGRLVTRECLAAYSALPADCTRPNIVFKVKNDLHLEADAPNRDLFLRACACTAKKMVPTYLLMDAEPNAACDPFLLNIMGCRTRVYANRIGTEGSVGRGNIAAVTINLPHLAFKAGSFGPFRERLEAVMRAAEEILLLRAKALSASRYLNEVGASGTWKAADAADICRQGTYSIGFIGIAETVEILGAGKLHESEGAVSLAKEILETMNRLTMRFGEETGLNFALLASPAEGVTGRFAEADGRRFPEAIYPRKGFLTNSFHVPVDAGCGVCEKLAIEGPFHKYATGGSISYVELREAPLGNTTAIEDIVRLAMASGVSYLGVNYPMDVCTACGSTGTFDACPACGSTAIKRIRRVSGYLETLDEFATGKKAEEAQRRANG